jgi:acetyltransferase-like isoleucine patch superfamily enzyme
MEKIGLHDFLKTVCIHPHPETRIGEIFFAKGLIDAGRFHARWDPDIILDLTGDLYIGKNTMLGAGTRIYTHDHYHTGRDKPLLQLQDEKGVMFQDKVIGDDVWIHGAVVLYQVTRIPDGVIVGAGSVLTKNPGAYEIWAGNPARKIGQR